MSDAVEEQHPWGLGATQVESVMSRCVGSLEEGEGGLIRYRARSSDYMHTVSYLPHPSLTPRCMAVARVDPTLDAGTRKVFRALKKLV
jgi:hypothetical protein